MTTQPNFTVGDNQALAETDYDRLPPDELLKLIAAAHKLKTGRTGNLHQAPPPPAKRVVDLDAIFGGKQ